MSAVFFVILPLILLVTLGFMLAKFAVLGKQDWIGVERLGFNLLIPALIINAIYQSDLSLKASGLYISVLILAILFIGFSP